MTLMHLALVVLAVLVASWAGWTLWRQQRGMGPGSRAAEAEGAGSLTSRERACHDALLRAAGELLGRPPDRLLGEDSGGLLAERIEGHDLEIRRGDSWWVDILDWVPAEAGTVRLVASVASGRAEVEIHGPEAGRVRALTVTLPGRENGESEHGMDTDSR